MPSRAKAAAPSRRETLTTFRANQPGPKRESHRGLAFQTTEQSIRRSTLGWQRRLGARWRVLHRLVYLAVPLAVAHYYWLDRDDRRPPVLYAIAVAALLAVRLPPLRRIVAQLRRS